MPEFRESRWRYRGRSLPVDGCRFPGAMSVRTRAALLPRWRASADLPMPRPRDAGSTYMRFTSAVPRSSSFTAPQPRPSIRRATRKRMLRLQQFARSPGDDCSRPDRELQIFVELRQEPADLRPGPATPAGPRRRRRQGNGPQSSAYPFARNNRALSRFQSRAFWVSRLSTLRLPLARPSASLAMPRGLK